MRTFIVALAVLLLFAQQVRAAEETIKDPAKELVEAAAKGDSARVAALLDNGAPVEGTADVKSDDVVYRDC